MDSNKNSKKIIILGLILLIIAGLIVVSLKGVNVSLLFGKHESIELKLGKEVNMKIINEICREVFQDKRYVAKELEVFGDSFQINIKSITDDEKTNLINKINEKFETQKTVEDLNIHSISNKRIRDVIKPYIVPMLVVFVIVSVYEFVRFRKMEAIKFVIDSTWKIVLTEIICLSVVSIVRIPVDDTVINIFMIIAIAGLIFFIHKGEKELAKIMSEERLIKPFSFRQNFNKKDIFFIDF